MPGLAYTVPTPTTVVFSESLAVDTDIMFIYGQLTPTPVLPNILSANIGYDFAVYYDGLTTASDTMFNFIAIRAFTLGANFTGSRAVAATAAAASTTFTVQKNGGTIGTFNFANGATTATFTAASPTSFASGDALKVVCPVTPDANLSDIALTLAGSIT
jgi:hypothetical protein